MRISSLTPYALGACCIAISLTGCAGSHAIPMPALPSGGLDVRAQTNGFQSLYDFTGSPNGAFPLSGLLPVNGTLYGTTTIGGYAQGSECGLYGCGVVFRISASGTEHVLYRFKGGSDGDSPEASLTDLGGTLYGTTTFGGGPCGCGAVFRISTAGSEQPIYGFKGYQQGDGENPGYNEALLPYNGALYGVTDSGGSYNVGTAYDVTPSGKERVLHTFGSTAYDGANPIGTLFPYRGMLYGSAYNGGRTGNGVIFAITTSGRERVLYDFKGGSDGSGPNSLIAVNGVFYGTTTYGGGSCGCGTVFAMTPLGRERVLYRFKGGINDGAYPGSGTSLTTVTHHLGMLYGTTSQGGCPSSGLCGIVFSVSTFGKEKVLFKFSFINGLSPSPLVSTNELLYGTTYFGGVTCYDSGSGGSGCGTVFRIPPK